MKKILFFILFTSLSLFADRLPNSIKTTVENVQNNLIHLNQNVPAGMSGIVIHNYGNQLKAITHDTVSLGNTKASIKAHSAIAHENIPSIQTPIHKGDTIIFGPFYQNALLIAPNHLTYQQLSKRFKRSWTHSDVFALEFMQMDESSLTMEILNTFAQKYQIGLVLVVAQQEILVIDPLSKRILQTLAYTPNTHKVETPFYVRFEPTSSSLFNTKKIYTPYFKSVAGLKHHDR